jgi:hypothetical protein
MNINYRISYSFVQLPDMAIADYTDTIVIALTGNAGFPALPVSLTVIGTQKTDYLTKLTATAQGGTLATIAKNDARDVLITSLRQTAAYVQSVASQDLQLLVSSGFQPVSTNRAQAPLDTPLVLDIDNSVTTLLILRMQPVVNARSYQVQYKSGTGDWVAAGTFTQARRIVVSGLTPGTVYTVQARAVGGSTGYSVWSAPQPRICT